MTVVAEGDEEASRAASLPAGAAPDVRSQVVDEDRSKADPKVSKPATEKAEDTMTRVRGSTMRALAKILSKGQREGYQKLVGSSFEFKKTWGTPTPRPSESKTKAQGS